MNFFCIKLRPFPQPGPYMVPTPEDRHEVYWCSSHYEQILYCKLNIMSVNILSHLFATCQTITFSHYVNRIFFKMYLMLQIGYI